MNNISSYKQIVKRLSEIPKSYRMIIDSFSILNINGSMKSWLGALVVTILIILGIDLNDIKVQLNIVSKILDLELAIFSVLFTIYSIVLIFLSDDFIDVMVNITKTNTDKEESFFEGYLSYLGHVLFIYFMGLIFTILLFFSLTVLDRMKPEISLTCLMYFAYFVYFVYFIFSSRIIWELQSVIYNVISIFRMSLSVRLNLLHECKRNKQQNTDS